MSLKVSGYITYIVKMAGPKVFVLVQNQGVVLRSKAVLSALSLCPALEGRHGKSPCWYVAIG